jgi:hypothetical protein
MLYWMSIRRVWFDLFNLSNVMLIFFWITCTSLLLLSPFKKCHGREKEVRFECKKRIINIH